MLPERGGCYANRCARGQTARAAACFVCRAERRAPAREPGPKTAGSQTCHTALFWKRLLLAHPTATAQAAPRRSSSRLRGASPNKQPEPCKGNGAWGVDADRTAPSSPTAQPRHQERRRAQGGPAGLCSTPRTGLFKAAAPCAGARGFILGCPAFHPLPLPPSCPAVCIAGAQGCLQRGWKRRRQLHPSPAARGGGRRAGQRCGFCF